MNAAAKTLSNNRWFVGSLTAPFALDRASKCLLLLILAVLLSGWAVIYSRNLQRTYFSQTQAQQQQLQRLTVERGQLLLEQSTWAAPQRVQRIAQNDFHMQLPEHPTIIVLSDPND